MIYDGTYNSLIMRERNKTLQFTACQFNEEAGSNGSIPFFQGWKHKKGFKERKE